MLLMSHKGGLGRRPPSHGVGSAVTAGSWGDTTHHCHRASEPAQPRGHREAIGTSLTVAAERGPTRGPVPPGGPDLDLSPCERPTPACRVRTRADLEPRVTLRRALPHGGVSPAMRQELPLSWPPPP